MTALYDAVKAGNWVS